MNTNFLQIVPQKFTWNQSSGLGGKGYGRTTGDNRFSSHLLLWN